MIAQVDSFEEEKKKLEFRLQRLGVAADKIAEAGKIDEREYCQVGEHEERDRADAKRKREEEDAKEKEEMKRQRVIPTVKGKYRKSYEIEGVEYEEEEEKDVPETEQERHMRILTEQQKAIIQNQAQLLQDQQKELDLQGSKIKKLIEEKKETKGKREEEESVINVEDEKKVKVEPSTSSGSGSSVGAFRLENLFKHDVLEKFIPGYKASQPESTDTTPTPISTSTTQQTQPSVFVPTGTQENVLLLQSVPSKVTECRSGRTRPVPKDGRLRHKHYCENCKSEFSRKDLLAQHIKNDCLQPIRQFVCKDCNAAFYSETAVREHYYKIYLKIELYHCQKCNMGFAHKSKKSTHKKICPNQNGKDQFPIRTHFDEELEASFKRCNIVPLQITDQQQPVQPLPQPPAPQETTPQSVQPQLVEPTLQVVETTQQVVEPIPQLPQLPQVQGEGEQQLGNIFEIQPGQGRNVEDLEPSNMLLALEQGKILENIMEGDVEDQNVVGEGEGNVDDNDYEEDDEDGEEDYMVGGGDEVQETVVSLPLDDDDE